jgi:COP9 signalosome complex subunit 4
VNKASPLINLVDDWLLQLRYRLTYARVLDANRKFIDAAIRYYELSMSTTTTHSNVQTNSTVQHSTPDTPLLSSLSSSEQQVSQDDVLELLAKAVTCAILGKASNQRSRVLGNLAQVQYVQYVLCLCQHVL